MRLKANVVCDTQQEPSDHPSDCSIALMGGSVCVLLLLFVVVVVVGKGGDVAGRGGAHSSDSLSITGPKKNRGL